MEQILDAVIAEINTLKDVTYDEGGFLDEIDLAGDVWFDDPGVLPAESYPFIFVEPVSTTKVSETTSAIERLHTVRIGLVADPRTYWDENEISEQSASREMVRTVESLRRHFERTSLRMPAGLAEGTTGLEVGLTDYAKQLRGETYAKSANITLTIRKKYLRLP